MRYRDDRPDDGGGRGSRGAPGSDDAYARGAGATDDAIVAPGEEAASEADADAGDESTASTASTATEDGAELSCGAIGGSLGLSPSLISHHLSVLEGAGVIERRKNGLWTLNRLRRDELSRRLARLEPLMRPAIAS